MGSQLALTLDSKQMKVLLLERDIRVNVHRSGCNPMPLPFNAVERESRK